MGVNAGTTSRGRPARPPLHADAATALAAATGGEALAGTVLVGGFGEPGTPFYLLDALADSGARGLTLIKNDANEPGVGVGAVLRAGAVRRLITSHMGLNPEAVAAMDEGRLQVEVHPQGILAEKIRCGGAGLPGFLSDLDEELLPEVGEARPTLTLHGRPVYVEEALRADFALVHAYAADPFGNLTYRASARNFNPLMATAARAVIVEVERVEQEPFDPDRVITPGAFVDHLVVVPSDFDPGSKAARLRRGERP